MEVINEAFAIAERREKLSKLESKFSSSRDVDLFDDEGKRTLVLEGKTHKTHISIYNTHSKYNLNEL